MPRIRNYPLTNRPEKRQGWSKITSSGRCWIGLVRTIVCQTRSIALSNPGRGAVVVALRWSTEIVNNLCHQKPKKEHRRKRPFGRFLLIQLVNHQLQTQPTHSSWDGADRANQYGGMQLLPCSALCELMLVQRDPVHNPARCTSRES